MAIDKSYYSGESIKCPIRHSPIAIVSSGEDSSGEALFPLTGS